MPNVVLNDNISAKKTRAKKGIVTVGTDHGYLRIQFPRSVSKTLFGSKNQKYLSLGLLDTQENRETAERIAEVIQEDIRIDNLDLTCQRYLKEVQLEKIQQSTETSNSTFPKLLSLFNEYCDYLKPLYARTTYLKELRSRFLHIVEQCPQDLTKPLEIRNAVLVLCCNSIAKRTLSHLNKMIEWAKDNGKLPPNFPNPYGRYNKDIKKKKPNDELPIQVLELEDYDYDSDYRAFTREEAEAIIAAFESITPKYWANVVKFLFWTGCRHGEAAALAWGDVAADCSYIIFRNSFDIETRTLKPVKTEEARKFPCGSKLRNLLLSIRPEKRKPSDWVFHNRDGNPINFSLLRTVWSGSKSKNVSSLIARLIKEGKVRQYLKPYAARHTFITLQLQSNVPIQNVAKLTGNSPGVIIEHYASAIPDVELAPEI
jgi:integrase